MPRWTVGVALLCCGVLTASVALGEQATEPADGAPAEPVDADPGNEADPVTEPPSEEPVIPAEEPVNPAEEPVIPAEEPVIPAEEPAPAEQPVADLVEPQDPAAPVVVDEGEPDCLFCPMDETEPVFSISRGPLTLGVVGSMQLLAVPWIQDPVASIEADSIANTEGFRLRRARFGIVGEFWTRLELALLFEYGDEGANILDAHLVFEPHHLARIAAGALKVPFSGITLLSREYQSFLDRPYAARTIAPDRSLGLRIDGSMHWFSYSLGIFNGGGDYYRGDNNDGMLYAARIEVHPLGPLPDGEVTQPDGPVFEVAGSYFFNQDAAGNRHAASGEVAFRWAGFSLRGEFLWSTFMPDSDPDTVEGIEYGNTQRMGWFAEAGYFILAEHLQLSVRYEGQRVSEVTEIRDLNDLWAISAAISGYVLQGRLKLTLQYQHRHEWFDVQESNDFVAFQLQGRI